MLIALAVLAALFALGLGVAAVLAVAARRTSTITLAEPAAVTGELLRIDEGTGRAETVVVRRVMRDRTFSNVVLVRSARAWHRYRWTRTWL